MIRTLSPRGTTDTVDNGDWPGVSLANASDTNQQRVSPELGDLPDVTRVGPHSCSGEYDLGAGHTGHAARLDRRVVRGRPEWLVRWRSSPTLTPLSVCRPAQRPRRGAGAIRADARPDKSHFEMPELGLGDMIRLLVVDEHPVIGEGIRAMLSDEPDLWVETVTDVNAANAALDARNHDIVISEIRLQGRNAGLDLLRYRRKDGLAFIIFSAQSIPSLYVEAVERGAAGFLSRTSFGDCSGVIPSRIERRSRGWPRARAGCFELAPWPRTAMAASRQPAVGDNAYVMVFIDARWTDHRYHPLRSLAAPAYQSQRDRADAFMGRGVFGW